MPGCTGSSSTACADIGRRRRQWRAEIALIRPEPAESDRRVRVGRPGRARARTPPSERGAADDPGPALLPRPASQGDGRGHGHPRRDRQVPAALRPRGAASGARRGLEDSTAKGSGGPIRMTGPNDLGTRLTDDFQQEAPTRAPDRVLKSALVTIESTPQRHVRVPWRNPRMNALFRVVAVAAAALAIIFGPLNLLPRGANEVGASPSPAGPRVDRILIDDAGRPELVRRRRPVALGPHAHGSGSHRPGDIRRHGTSAHVHAVRLCGDRRRFRLADGLR